MNFDGGIWDRNQGNKRRTKMNKPQHLICRFIPHPTFWSVLRAVSLPSAVVISKVSGCTSVFCQLVLSSLVGQVSHAGDNEMVFTLLVGEGADPMVTTVQPLPTVANTRNAEGFVDKHLFKSITTIESRDRSTCWCRV